MSLLPLIFFMEDICYLADSSMNKMTQPVGVEVKTSQLNILLWVARQQQLCLHKISAEYFSNENRDGQYFNPTDHMFSGLEAHRQERV